MVMLGILAAIGIIAIFVVCYWLVTVKFPKVGTKINKFAADIGSSFKKKNSETTKQKE
jgi:hypothetical protein